MIKALIVDDERLARLEIRRLLKIYPQVEVIGEGKNAEEAASLISGLRPDLIFMNINIPLRDRFPLVVADEPKIIFTTGFDKSAVEELSRSGASVLYKPIAPSKLNELMEDLFN